MKNVCSMLFLKAVIYTLKCLAHNKYSEFIAAKRIEGISFCEISDQKH